MHNESRSRSHVVWWGRDHTFESNYVQHCQEKLSSLADTDFLNYEIFGGTTLTGANVSASCLIRMIYSRLDTKARMLHGGGWLSRHYCYPAFYLGKKWVRCVNYGLDLNSCKVDSQKLWKLFIYQDLGKIYTTNSLYIIHWSSHILGKKLW